LVGLLLAVTLSSTSSPAAALTAQAPGEGDPSTTTTTPATTTTTTAADKSDPSSASGRPGQTDEASQPDGPRVTLVGQTPWVRPGEQLHLRFTVAEVPDNAVVQLTVHDELIIQADFAGSLEGELGRTVNSPPPQPLSSLAPATDGSREIVKPVNVGGGDGIVVPEDGAFPVELLLTDAAGTTITSLITYLLVLPASTEQFPPLSVAVVVEVGGPPGLQPDGTVQPDNDTVANINDRIDALAQAPEIPVTVAPLPETLDTLADWGDPGADLLDRLDSAVGDRGLISRSYVDVDIDALVNAGLGGQMSPEALAGAQTVREQLGEPLEHTWLTGATVGDGEVEALRNLGIQRTVVPETAVEDLAEQDEGPVPLGPVALSDDGPLAAVANDDLASHLFEDNGQLGAQRFLAGLTLIWATRPAIADRGVVVRIPEGATVDAAVLGSTLEALGDGGAVQAVSLDDYFSLQPVGGEEPLVIKRTPDDNTNDLGSIARPLEDGQRAISGLAATLDDRTTIQSLHRALLVALASDLDGTQRLAYINRVGNVVGQLSADVNAPAQFTITLTARSGTIPLTIENNADQAVAIAVLLQSSQLEFPDGGSHINVIVPPGGRRLDLSVRTRTSGAFPLHITLTSPDRNIVLDRTTFTIRSTAVSGVGLVLSVGAGLFLLVWWARHWRTARRSRRLVTESPGGSPGASPG
jgi:hypothetical protein